MNNFEEAGRRALNILFFSLSALLSINLFLCFDNAFYMKILWGVGAVSLEGFKLFLWSKCLGFHIAAKASETSPRGTVKAKRGEYRKKALAYFFVYLIAVLFSLGASYGFTVSSIEKQSRRAGESSVVMDMRQKSIDEINRQIEILLKRQSELSEARTYGNRDIVKQISDLRAQRDAIVRDMSAATTDPGNEEGRVTDSGKIFEYIGKPFGIPRDTMMFILMFAVAILFEVGIAMTATPKVPGRKNARAGKIEKGLSDILESLTVLFEKRSAKILKKAAENESEELAVVRMEPVRETELSSNAKLYEIAKQDAKAEPSFEEIFGESAYPEEWEDIKINLNGYQPVISINVDEDFNRATVRGLPLNVPAFVSGYVFMKCVVNASILKFPGVVNENTVWIADNRKRSFMKSDAEFLKMTFKIKSNGKECLDVLGYSTFDEAIEKSEDSAITRIGA